MKCNFKSILKYSLLFVLFFSCIHIFYISFNGDSLFNFGFSYAVARGEVPYRDFNMIIPPFGAMFYAIPFLFFGSNLLVFNLFQAFLLCMLFYFLFKLFDKRAYLFIPILLMFFPIPFNTILFGGYNFLLLFELVILLYLEKNKKSDYLIGIVLGLSILTKQTVGFCLLLPSIYYLFKDRKKVYKRIIGFLSLCLLFLCYLFLTGSLYQFIDLCFLGMFDFTRINGTIMDYNFLIFIIIFIFICIKIYKDKGNINNYYVLAFLSIAVPLFDYYHVALAVFGFLFLIIDKIKIKYSTLNLAFNCFLFSLFLPLFWFFKSYDLKSLKFTNFNHFEGKVMSLYVMNQIENINNYIKDNKEQNIIILGSNAYFFKITNDLDINYYDLLNYGNHGYNGTEKLINMIKEEKDPIFIINIFEYEDNSNDRQQINKDVMKYVLDNYEEVDVIEGYHIYSDSDI